MSRQPQPYTQKLLELPVDMDAAIREVAARNGEPASVVIGHYIRHGLEQERRKQLELGLEKIAV
jgi:hypothetical protein